MTTIELHGFLVQVDFKRDETVLHVQHLVDYKNRETRLVDVMDLPVTVTIESGD